MIEVKVLPSNLFWNAAPDPWSNKKKVEGLEFSDDDRQPWDVGPNRAGLTLLEAPRSKSFGAPIVVLLMGRRGHGKTLFMTAMARHMIKQWDRLNADYRLFSNYRIDYMRKDKSGRPIDMYSPYLIEDVMGYPDWFRNGYLLLDEIQTAASGRRSMSRSNVFLSTFLTQIRHRNIEAIFTTQFPQVLDYQLLLQVDLFVDIDIAHRGKGGVPEVLTLYVHDYWGQWTGKNWRKYWPPRQWEADAVKRITNVSSVVGHYSTEQIIVPTFMDDWSRAQVIESKEAKFEDESDWHEEVREEITKAQDAREEPRVHYGSLDDYLKGLPPGELRISEILRPARKLSNITAVTDLATYLSDRGWLTYRDDKGIWMCERSES